MSLCLMRLGAPSAHAWRRGWAFNALRCGVSETSVRATADWSSAAMVACYISALSRELAVDELEIGGTDRGRAPKAPIPSRSPHRLKH
jgi:hypothetical protein